MSSGNQPCRASCSQATGQCLAPRAGDQGTAGSRDEPTARGCPAFIESLPACRFSAEIARDPASFCTAVHRLKTSAGARAAFVDRPRERRPWLGAPAFASLPSRHTRPRLLSLRGTAAARSSPGERRPPEAVIIAVRSLRPLASTDGLEAPSWPHSERRQPAGSIPHNRSTCSRRSRVARPPSHGSRDGPTRLRGAAHLRRTIRRHAVDAASALAAHALRPAHARAAIVLPRLRGASAADIPAARICVDVASAGDPALGA